MGVVLVALISPTSAISPALAANYFAGISKKGYRRPASLAGSDRALLISHWRAGPPGRRAASFCSG